MFLALGLGIGLCPRLFKHGYCWTTLARPGNKRDVGQLRRRRRRLVDALATIQLMFQFIEEYGATLSGIGNGSARP